MFKLKTKFKVFKKNLKKKKSHKNPKKNRYFPTFRTDIIRRNVVSKYPAHSVFKTVLDFIHKFNKAKDDKQTISG